MHLNRYSNSHHVISNGGPDMTDDRRHDAFFVITSNNNGLTKPSITSPLLCISTSRMSAIILTQHTPTRPKPTRMSTKQLTPQLRTTERTPLLSASPTHGGHIRTVPLKESLSTTRFITICIGIFSANFVFAFQTTSMPTLMTGISSGYGHAELGSYLGSVFTLANTAGMSTFQFIQGGIQSGPRLMDSNSGIWGIDGVPRT